MTPQVEGVRIRRHVLDHEAARLCGIAQRLGRRLSYWLRAQPVHELPGEEFRETFRLYAQTTLGLLKEQRERAKLAPGKGAPPIDDATFESEVAQLARRALLEMPRAELDELLRERHGARRNSLPFVYESTNMEMMAKREAEPPKLGRPRRAETAAHHVVCARVTSAERAVWVRAAGKLALSEWIRETCNAAARRGGKQ